MGELLFFATRITSLSPSFKVTHLEPRFSPSFIVYPIDSARSIISTVAFNSGISITRCFGLFVGVEEIMGVGLLRGSIGSATEYVDSCTRYRLGVGWETIVLCCSWIVLSMARNCASVTLSSFKWALG